MDDVTNAFIHDAHIGERQPLSNWEHREDADHRVSSFLAG